MDSGPCSLYIVTPDANAAVLKRLRGLGISMGVCITPVSQLADLPSHPGTYDLLLIPDYLLNGESPAHKWANVFTISSSQKQVNKTNSNSVLFYSRDEQTIDWVQITCSIVKNFMKTPQNAVWFGIHHEIASKISTPSTEFAMWAGSYKSLAALKIDRVSKTLRSLERQLTGSKSCPFTLKINMEPGVLNISLNLKDNKPLDLDKISSLFESLDFCQEATISQQDGLMVNASFNLGATKVNRITICVVKPIALMGTAISRKEVS